MKIIGRLVALTLAIVSAVSMSGCFLAVPVVAGAGMYLWDPSDELIAERAAFALGTTPDKIQISDVEKSGMYGGRYDFKATYNNQVYTCYLTFTAGNASDALCNSPSGQSVTQPGQCNELLRAAGRC